MIMDLKYFIKKLNNILILPLPLLAIFGTTVMINTFSKYYVGWQMDESRAVKSQVCRFEGDQFHDAEIKSAEPAIFFGIQVMI